MIVDFPETPNEFAPRVIPEGKTIVADVEDVDIPVFKGKKHSIADEEKNAVVRQHKTQAERAMSDIASTVDDVDSIREEVSVSERTETTVKHQAGRIPAPKREAEYSGESVEVRTEERSEATTKSPSTKKQKKTAIPVEKDDDEEFDEISEISEITERVERRTVRRTTPKAKKIMVDAGTDAAPYAVPKLHRPAKHQKMITVKEEEDFTLEVPFTGAPKPDFTWLKDGQPVKESKHVQTDVTNETVVIRVSEATKKDSGRYTLIAENFAGIDKIDIGVKVIGEGEVVNCPGVHEKLTASSNVPSNVSLHFTKNSGRRLQS